MGPEEEIIFGRGGFFAGLGCGLKPYSKDGIDWEVIFCGSS